MAAEFMYQGNRKISVSEAMEDPSMREVATAFLQLEAQPWLQYDTQKYVLLQRRRIQENIARYLIEHPAWTLKDALSALAKDFPSDMSPEQVLKFTKIIIREWKSVHDAVGAVV
jgi:hypothetical protein